MGNCLGCCLGCLFVFGCFVVGVVGVTSGGEGC